MKTVMTRSALKIAMVMCLLGCGIPIVGCSYAMRAKAERTIEVQHALASGSAIQVKTSSGSIGVEGQETDECRVTARIRVRAQSEAKARDIADQIEIGFHESSGGLEIAAEHPTVHGISISISYDVIVPQQTTVTAQSSSGSVKVVGTEGDVDARSSSGSVSGENLSGDHARLHTSSGSVHLTQATFASCDLHTSSGSIHGQNLNCPQIKANVSSGSIGIDCAQGTPPDLNADLASSSGSVTLSVPPTFQGHVDLATSSGSIHTDLPVTIQGKAGKHHLSGTVGQGSGNIRLRTSSGSVNLREK